MVDVTGPDDFREIRTIAWDEFTIGGAGYNDLVLPGLCDVRLRLYYRPGELALHDEISYTAQPIAPGERVAVGTYTLVFSWVPREELAAELAEVEAELIRTIEHTGDPAARL